jgi:glutamyl-tRNA reductase
MDLSLIGVSHRTAPIEIRERLAFDETCLVPALHRLKEEYRFSEALILSTCNRVEILVRPPNGCDAFNLAGHFLYTSHAVDPQVLDKYLYRLRGEDLVRHVFRTASSLDSMVVGESQILGQLKKAFEIACRAGASGPQLHSLMNRAFGVAKRVRTETRVCASAVSISYVAVELARKILGCLKDRSILLLGAGKMSELAASNLMRAGISQVFVANRTGERAEQLAARFNAKAVTLDDLQRCLVTADIALVSTGAGSFVLDRELLQQVIRERRYRPLFIIDIAVPRNVDPRVNEIGNVFLYDIDDLQSVIQANLQERKREAEIAEGLVSEEVGKFLQRQSSRNNGSLAGQLRSRVESICLEELEKHRQNLQPAEYERLERILINSAHKIAHPLIMQIKNADPDLREEKSRLDFIRKAFGLNEEE